MLVWLLLLLLMLQRGKEGYLFVCLVGLELAVRDNTATVFLIQVDIKGHPPIPFGPPPLFLSVF